MEEKDVVIQHDYSSIESVPAEARHISFGSMLSTWAGIALQPATWTVCGYMICAGLAAGLLALCSGAAYIFLTCALFGYMTFKTGLSSMGMTRFTLGVRGTKIVTTLSVINSLGWVTVTSYLAAITISYILKAIFHTPAVGEPGSVPIMVVSCIVIVILEWLAIAIDGSRTLKIFQTIMIIALLVFSVVIFIALFRLITWEDIKNFKVPDDAKMSFGTCFDTIVSGIITIAIFGGDLCRYAVKSKSAKYAGFAGGFPALIAFGLMAILGIIAAYASTGTFDLNNANPSTLSISLGLGIPALIVVLFSTITTSMMDIYTISNSLTNLFEGWSYKKAVLIAGIAAVLTCWIPVVAADFTTYFYSFIGIVGAVFPPMLVIMMTDFYLLHKQHYAVEDAAKAGGRYWFQNGFNIRAIVAWVLGSFLYFMLHNYWMANSPILSNMIVSMLASMVIYLLIMKCFPAKENA